MSNINAREGEPAHTKQPSQMRVGTKRSRPLSVASCHVAEARAAEALGDAVVATSRYQTALRHEADSAVEQRFRCLTHDLPTPGSTHVVFLPS